MGLKEHIQVLLAQSDGGGALFVGLVTGDDHVLVVRTLEDDDGNAIGLFARYVALHTTTGRHEVGEVLHSIELRCVAVDVIS